MNVTVDGRLYRPVPIGDRLGFSPGAPIGFGGHDVPADLAVVQQAGFRWLRLDCFDNGAPNLDHVVEQATAAELDVLMIIDNPTFSAGPAAYAQTCTQVARRYALLGVHHYELVNEPNLGRIGQEDYRRLLPAAVAAVKTADPDAYVLVGSLAPGSGVGDPYWWGRALINIQPTAGYDALSFHPYCTPLLPLTQPALWSTWTRMGWLHDYAMARGLDLPIWATEFGGSIPAGWTEARQTLAFHEAAWALERSPWLARLFWFSIRDGAEHGEQARYFGVIREDGSARPVLAAMTERTKRAP